MSDYGGYIFTFDEPRRGGYVTDVAEREGRFTEVVSGPDWQPKQAEIGFVSMDDGVTLTWAGLIRRGNRVATSKWRITFSHLVELGFLTLDEVANEIGSQFRRHFIRTSSGVGGRVPPRTWANLVDTVKRLRPGCAEEIDRLDALRKASLRSYSSDVFSVVAQEKDAVGLALDISGIRRKPESLSWVAGNAPAPFLRELERAQLREDTMIAHDASTFEGWQIVRRYQVGAVTFGNHAQRLTVVNVNRTPIERTLGVDLIYFNHRFRSFVMVQYKRMTNRGGASLKYWPSSDSSYVAEIERMLAFEGKVGHLQPARGLRDYRLNPGAFYFKLCPAISFDPLSSSLIKGMYIPLEYWQILIAGGRAGSDRGFGISFDTAERHLDNTLFAHLVEKGWIGSRLKVTKVIEDLVSDLLRADHSVILAEGKQLKDR